MRVFETVEDMIGGTPLLHVVSIEKELQLQGKVYAKLECMNPGGSSKDRAAKQMLKDALEKGQIDEKTVIVEPTSGNTGIGLAALAASRGMKAIIVMPSTMSNERRMLIGAYGAQLVLVEGGMPAAIEKANALCKTLPNAFLAGQFTNPSNAKAHYLTTGPEIFADLEGKIDVFVAGVGTGGTITGVGKYLKEQNPSVHLVAVEPKDSPVLSGGQAGSHGIQGIGAGFVPNILDVSLIDEIMQVTVEQSFTASRLLAKKQGVLVGISSGAALYGAIELAKQPQYKGKNIVVLLPDTGERYLSTPLFQNETV